MKQRNYFVTYLLLLAAQILICNYLRISQYVFLTLLPVMVLCIPVRHSTITTMIIAFITGLCVDFLAEGVPGLNTVALVAVAFVRNEIISLVFGSEVFARKDNISKEKHGPAKMSSAIILSLALFLIIYIGFDGAASRPFWFNLVRFAASLLASYVLSIIVSGPLTDERQSR